MSMKVLIADPDGQFSRGAARYLEAHAHHVVVDPSGRDVPRTARHWRPDLVILAAELAETGIIEDLHDIDPRPALLLTEHMDQYQRAWRAWQRGGDELLMKPVFRTHELHQAVVAATESAAAGKAVRPALAASA